MRHLPVTRRSLSSPIPVRFASCGGGADDPTVVAEGAQHDLGRIDAEHASQITVAGEVTEAISPAVFTLATEDSQDGDVLVVGTAETAVSTGQLVEVTGTVSHIAEGFAEDTGLDPGEEGLYRDIGVDDEQDFITHYEGDTSIIAERIEILATDQ